MPEPPFFPLYQQGFGIARISMHFSYTASHHRYRTLSKKRACNVYGERKKSGRGHGAMQHKTSCNGIDPPMIGCGAFQIQDSRQCEHLRPTSSGGGKTASKFRAIGVSNMAPKVKIWKAFTPPVQAPSSSQSAGVLSFFPAARGIPARAAMTRRRPVRRRCSPRPS